MGLLYLILHEWLSLSNRVVAGVMLSVAVLLTVSFLMVFLTASIPSSEQRLAARLKYALALALALELGAAGIFAWMIHFPSWRGWLVSGSAFLVAAAGGGIASWAAYRRSLKRNFRNRLDPQGRV
jgi:hypothetical protein